MDLTRGWTSLRWIVLLFAISLPGLNPFNIDDRLKHPTTYAIVAPKVIRPDQVVQVYISIFALRYPFLYVRASIRRYGEELATAIESFKKPSSRMTQLRIPEHAESGNYTLLVEATVHQGSRIPIFSNQTELIFQPKRVSVFIFTDQFFYNEKTKINFRVVAVKPNLLAVSSGSIDIFLKDPNGNKVRRLENQLVNYGYYEGVFGLGSPYKRGMWTIEVQGWGYSYHKQVLCHKAYQTKFEHVVEVAPVMSDNDYAIGGSVRTYNTQNHMPIKGNATIEVEVLKKDSNQEFPRVKKTYSMIHGEFAFNVPLSEIRDTIGESVANTDVYIHAKILDIYGLREEIFDGFTHITSGEYLLRILGGEVRVFKPGQPLDVKVALFSPSGQKMSSKMNRLVKVHTLISKAGSSEQKEGAIVVGDDSMVHYQYLTQPEDEFIRVSVSYTDGKTNAYKEMTAYRHFSKSNNYLYVTTSTVHPEVDSYIVFTIRSTTFIPEIFYQIVANGNIMVADKIFMESQQKTFAVAASRDMIPNARIVTWAIMNSGEMLADSLSFHVSGITLNPMELRVNSGKDVRTSTVEINAFTDPAAFSGFSAELEEIIKLGVRPFFNEYDVEEELLTYDIHANTSMKHTWHDGKLGRENIFYPAPSYAIDANMTFVFSGLVMLTDSDLPRIEAAIICNLTLGYLPCFDGSCYRIEDNCNGARQCEDGADEMGCPEENLPEHPPQEILSKLTWKWAWLFEKREFAWKKFFTKPYGRIDFRVDVPSRPTTWLVGGFSLDREKGLRFSVTPGRIETANPVMIVMELPKAAFRGEQLGVQISIFNFMDQPVDAILQLHDSDDYRFIRVEDNGYVSSYSPRTTRGDIQTMVTLTPGESRQIHFPILPMRLGKIAVTVSLQSFIMAQEETKTVTISMEGITNHYNSPVLLDLVSTGSLIIPYLQVPVPERFIDPGNRRHLYVPGSGQASVSIVGDVVGPGLYTSHLDTYKIFRRVGGMGENYIHDLATNLYWLRFLKTANQLPNDLLESALEGINLDLQTIYVFKQSDGGVALRRKRSSSDVWTTALALEVLATAIMPEWEQILYVDATIVQGMGTWLISRLNTTTGAFINNGDWYNLNVKDTLMDAHGYPANISITARAVVALHKTVGIMTGETKSKVAPAINLAGDYLIRMLPKLVEPFQICLVAYALHEINHQNRGVAFAKMVSIQRTDNYIYWSREPILSNKLEFINGLPYLYPRDMPTEYHANAVQATSYALMVYLRKNLFHQATPIMKWLQTQRDYTSGFSSTGDSLVALQALIDYAERETNRDLYRMHVNVEASSSSNWKNTLTFDKSNYLTMSQVNVPVVWGAVRMSAAGSGVALCQLGTKVNVEYPDQIRQPPVRAFDLDIENLRFFGRNASKFEMTVCLTWTATHLGEQSGAAILEVDIPTGYHVRKIDVRRQQPLSRIFIKRARYTKHKVVYYFDHLDTTRTCFYFPSQRWYPVANSSIQHEIKVYDTFEPALINRTIYTTYDLFHLHMCQVCGSFQCPYCPFYNAATRTRIPPSIYTMLILMLSITYFTRTPI